MKLLLLLICTVSFSSGKEWWENANYYQIYPRSYMDSDDNGIGDLKGIKSKVPYLKELGINGVWLSPIMKSPMVDHGYDISDYRDIDPLFGTLEDFDELVAECRKHDIHMILDFVPNHTSNLHEWFVKSEAKEEGYEDYYIWHKGYDNPADPSKRLPPSNWISVFRFSTWTWSEVRQEFYYHVFVKEQPDLNYRNQKVVDDMKNVMRFWLERGVSGFRIDAVLHLFEVPPDAEGKYPDEPVSGTCDDKEGYCYHNHLYTKNQPETLDMVTQWRAVLEEFRDKGPGPRVMMTEAGVPIDILMQYFKYENKNGSHIPFNFELFVLNKESTARDIQSVIENYLNHLPVGYSGNWVLGNHDISRLATRLGVERADLYNILLQTLPGHAVTYQGEELAMTDGWISWEDTQDPGACNTNKAVYEQYTRDPCRTPFHWDATQNGGFSKAAKTWLPMASNYQTVNVAAQVKDPNSHLALFKKLVQLHKESGFRDGLYESIRGVDDDVYAFLRSSDSQKFLVVLNFGKSPKELNVAQAVRGLNANGKVVAASVNSKLAIGTVMKSSSINLPVEAGVVLDVSGAPKLFTGTMLILSFLLLTYFL